MTRMLASVANAAEAGVAVQLGADIIDLKDARRGALGAVSLDVARQSIAAVAGRSETSAALGDPPYNEDALLEAAPSQDLPSIFQASRDHGLEPANVNQIAREWATRVDLREDEVRSYLTENIHYDLDSGCIEGLQLFYRYAAEIGALPSAPGLHFAETTKAAAI